MSVFVAGVMGWPVSHSLSPRLHGFWLRAYGISGRYDALAVQPENLTASLRALPQQGMRGVNLTVPHKEAAMKIVDSLDDTARRIGAINLVTVTDEGKLHGSNTDAYGFGENLTAGGFSGGHSALLLGAGGASRAIIVALIDKGFGDIRIANRTIERAQKLAQEFTTPQCRITAVTWDEIPAAMRETDLLVNATSLGMRGQPPLEIALDTLPVSATVTDIVYAPLETALLQQARQRGHRAIDGLGMLLHQARPAFAAFFGRDPEVTPELRAYLLADRQET
ncbi:MAG: shikimate dehydrogenase [Alphaproteobacteria bacterium]|nr:shikimate dehydrogenase [Alphaproteobacteria bacterium]